MASLISKGNKKWELRISAGYDKNGKQIRFTKTVYCETKKQAKHLLAEFEIEKGGKPVIDHDMKFKDFADYWLARHCKNLSVTTVARHKQILESRLVPAFGEMRLGRITASDIIRFMNWVSSDGIRLDNKTTKSGLSYSTVTKHLKLLKLIFSRAYNWGYISRNPCEDIPKDVLTITKDTKHYPIWSQEELGAFINILEKEPVTYQNLRYKLMFYISLTCGTRKGELMALTWDCIDMDNLSITINKAVKYVNEKAKGIGTPKTSASNRTLYFDGYIKDLLLKYKELQELWLKQHNAKNSGNLVFFARILTNDRETMLIDGNCFYLWLKRKIMKHGLRRIGVHSLRAMAATYALMAGTPLNMVQAMLGHTSINTTAIYIHDIADSRKEYTPLIAAQFEAMRKDKPKPTLSEIPESSDDI